MQLTRNYIFVIVKPWLGNDILSIQLFALYVISNIVRGSLEQ